MITYDCNKKMYHFTTPDTSYVFRLNGDFVVENLYYGKKLSSTDGLISKDSSYFPPFSAANAEYADTPITTESICQEYAFFGSCDMRTPSLHAVYEDGSRITKMRFVSHRIYGGKPTLPGLPATYVESDDEADTLEITFIDDVTGLELTHIYTAFSKYNAITRCVIAKNKGSQNINIKKIMSFSLDFPRADFDFIHLPGAWARERHIERNHLLTGTNHIESRRGSSSHHHSPFFALADNKATETQGDVYGFSFVYSGNFEAGAEVDTYGNTRAYMGINSFDFNWLLEAGEEFVSPEVVLVYSSNGLGEMSRTYHGLYRSRLARGKYRDIERPILINNWEATYMDFDESKILELASKAKQAGIEMLVLDDGWFGKRNDTTSSLGDWYPNKQKLPDGIDGIGKKINSLGLKFGLWFEPEMVSPDSELYRAHPDWCLHVNNRKSSLSRDQLILDLSRQDVCDYIINSVSNILENASVKYVKWDMNRNMTEVGSERIVPNRQQEVYHRYMLGLYSVLQTLIDKFPDVLFEGCSGGGGRFDAGMMHYFSQYWTSDNSDAVERMYIQHGTSLVMPSVFMGAHVSAVPNHQIGRITPLETRATVAFGGQLGYELDITKFSDEELDEIKSQIKIYKKIREVIHKGDLYRLLSPFDDNMFAWQYVSNDNSKVILCAGITNAKPQQKPKAIKLQGLISDKLYRLEETGETFSGDVLMNRGFYVRYRKDYIASTYIFNKCN